MDEKSAGDGPGQTAVEAATVVEPVAAVNEPVTSAPAPDDMPPDAPKSDVEPTENDSTAATWWGSWSNSNWAKTITGKPSNFKNIRNFEHIKVYFPEQTPSYVNYYTRWWL